MNRRRKRSTKSWHFDHILKYCRHPMTKSDFLYFYDYDHFFSFSQRSVTTPKPVEWELTTNCEWVRNPLVVIQVIFCQISSKFWKLNQNMMTDFLLNYVFSMCYFTSNCSECMQKFKKIPRKIINLNS